MSHYQDNLPDKENREFANVPSVMPLNAALTKLGGVEAGAIIDPAIAIRAILPPIFQCHLQQLELIRRPQQLKAVSSAE